MSIVGMINPSPAPAPAPAPPSPSPSPSSLSSPSPSPPPPPPPSPSPPSPHAPADVAPHVGAGDLQLVDGRIRSIDRFCKRRTVAADGADAPARRAELFAVARYAGAEHFDAVDALGVVEPADERVGERRLGVA